MKGTDLRNSILQMAVQGKLVPQDPNDEPASALLERIREQRRRLVAEGKIKAPKGGESVIYRASDGRHYEKRIDAKGHESDPVCIDDEIPFEIPENWEWVRMGDVLTFMNGRAYKKPELLENGKYPVLRVGNLFTNSSWYYSDLELAPEKYCHSGDLLYAWSASFGPTIWEGGECIFHYHIWNILHSNLLNREYLYWFLLDDVNRVKNFTTGSTMIHISMEHMIPRLLAIPPANEQRRIIEKLKEVTPKIEQYDALETAREKLDAELPDRLRKSILQMAVQGKLVSQDPDDEPASVLLERIREQRHQLIAEGKIKAPKGGESVIFRDSDGGYYEKRVDVKGHESDSVCIDDEIPFEIPESWEWARLGSLCNYGQCTNVEYANINDGTWVLELEQIEKGSGQIIEKTRKYGGTGSTKHVFKQGFVLYSKLRPYLNKVVIADEDGASTSEIFPLDFLGMIDVRFAQLVLMSPYFIDYADFCSYGVKMPRLGTTDGQNALFPVPPKKEQGRISNLANMSLQRATNR